MARDESGAGSSKPPVKQTKRPQRGQKKQKKPTKETVHRGEKVREGAPSPDLRHDNGETLATREAVTELTSEIDNLSLPPKSAKKSRKRKDGFDPKELAQEISVPSEERLEAVLQTSFASRDVVSRPSAAIAGISKRQREIKQLERRYGQNLTIHDAQNKYVVPFTPSDPDFPYELAGLFIGLCIPEPYPEEPITMNVQEGLEVGFARNIERAFVDEKIGYGYAGRGILGMLTWLDRNLERLLAMKKSETIKIVRPKGSSELKSVPLPGSLVKHEVADCSDHLTTPAHPVIYTPNQLEDASIIRRSELSKLRMIHPSRLLDESFDLDLSNTTKIRLQVPEIFPLEPAWLMVIVGDERMEQAANRALTENERGLSRTINWIAANLSNLIEEPETSCRGTAAPTPDRPAPSARPAYADINDFVLVSDHIYAVQAEEENHAAGEGATVDFSSGDDYDYESSDDADESADISEKTTEEPSLESEVVQQAEKDTLESTHEKGTAINTTINLTNISLLVPISLSLNLKCLRCKSTGNHLDSILNSKESVVQCPTCSAQLSVSFRGQTLHQGNTRIGYLDLIGASVLDLGPGTFSPTCEKCDTVGVAFKGLIAGQPQTRPCRHCHIKQIVAITSTSFLVINSAVKKASIGVRDAQNLSLQRGHALPANGVCKHYRKSNRWFRFNCCGRVYACDICHDVLADHPMELARFQICGWCSKESAIRGLKPCVHCGRDLTRRSKGGYWEGGQGTRDQNKMSRNDPRKHRKKIGSSGIKT